MAVPVDCYTFDYLVLKVAEKLAIASYRTDGTPYLPVSDAFNLEKCCEIAKRGILLIDSHPPKNGWLWKRRICTVLFDAEGDGSNNIEADPARYMLPIEFGGEICGKIKYASNSNRSADIKWVDESFIRARRAVNVQSGYPLYAAIRPYSPTSPTLATNRRWELIVDPEPTSADTVEFPYIINFDSVRLIGGIADSASATTIVDATLATYPNDYFNGWVAEIVKGTGQGSYATVTDFTKATGTVTVADWLDCTGTAGGTDPGASSEFVLKPIKPYYHPVGFAFDGVVEIACLAACEIFCQDKLMDNHCTNLFFETYLPKAYEINNRMRPTRLGKHSNGPSDVRNRTWNNVITSHDI
jgi:hypothetical protein